MSPGDRTASRRQGSSGARGVKRRARCVGHSLGRRRSAAMASRWRKATSILFWAQVVGAWSASAGRALSKVQNIGRSLPPRMSQTRTQMGVGWEVRQSSQDNTAILLHCISLMQQRGFVTLVLVILCLTIDKYQPSYHPVVRRGATKRDGRCPGGRSAATWDCFQPQSHPKPCSEAPAVAASRVTSHRSFMP
jgi:hypothetical protein